MKILWLTNIPAPYRVNFFNLLGKESNLDVVYEKKHSKNRNLNWHSNKHIDYKAVFLIGINYNSDHIISFGVLKYLFRKYDVLIISNPISFIGLFSSIVLNIFRKKYIIESDGGFVRHQESKMRFYIKKFIYSNAALLLYTNQSHFNYYSRYQSDENKLKKYPFACEFYKDILNNESKDTKSVNQPIRFLFVGRFIESKGLIFLLESTQKLSGDYELHITGGTIEELNKIILYDKSKIDFRNIHIHEFMDKQSLNKKYLQSDVFVFPTLSDTWGLVINEAVSHGLPVITTDQCGASEELVSEGKNGTILKKITTTDLANSMQHYINNPQIIQKQKKESYKIAKTYSIEKMVSVHIDLFNSIKSVKK